MKNQIKSKIRTVVIIGALVGVTSMPVSVSAHEGNKYTDAVCYLDAAVGAVMASFFGVKFDGGALCE